MTRVKIDYGIDLGTTNSAIARMDNGEISIIKSDRYQKDTTPSCVSFTKKGGVNAGDMAFNTFQKEKLKRNNIQNAFIEFKRTMGTDKKYFSSNADNSFSSEELSAEVLKQLKSYVRDENFNAAVITVPNQFRQNQVDATQRAAELAGFAYCELLQEPIAASMAYGVTAENMDGHWIVFDFGGGTFDTALMKVDEGIMKVVDTDGDNHLGGKNIDLAIVDDILLPWLQNNEEYTIDNIITNSNEKDALRNALKVFAEEIKITLSSSSTVDVLSDEPIGEDDNGDEIELDLTISLQDYEKVVKPIFQSAIDVTKKLIQRNNLEGNNLTSILLVGGPTFSQTLRKMLAEQLNTKVDSSIDPMTSVARGAALFASTKNIPTAFQTRDTSKIQLILKYPETTVETEEHLGVRLDRENTVGDIPGAVMIEFTRSDQAWTSGKVRVEDGEIITIHLAPGKSNGFNINVYDEQGNALECEPSRFTIIQGLEAAKPTLPKSMCIDSILSESGKQRLVLLGGLGRNQTLPAKGKETFKTQKDIRPGKSDDVIRIALYEGEPGERSIYNQAQAIINVTGSDLAEFLPAGSDVELTVKMDESRRITLEAYLPYIDETIERIVADHHDTEQKEYDPNELENEIKKAKHSLVLLEGINTEALNNDLDKLMTSLQNGWNDYEAKLTVRQNLQKILKEIDKLEASSEWPQAEEKLNAALDRVETINERYGNEKTTNLLNQFKQQARTVIEQQNTKLAGELTEQISTLDFALVRQDVGLWISYIKEYNDNFDSQDWNDRGKAKQLIDTAKQIISTQPSREKIEAIVFALFELLPDKDKPLLNEIDKELLAK